MIRTTWAAEIQKLNSKTEIVFFLGKSPESKINTAIRKEFDEFKDVIVEDFVDNYNNLTLKSVFLLKLASQLKKTNFIFKVRFIFVYFYFT